MELLQFGKLAYDLHVPQVSWEEEEGWCTTHNVLVVRCCSLDIRTHTHATRYASLTVSTHCFCIANQPHIH